MWSLVKGIWFLISLVSLIILIAVLLTPNTNTTTLPAEKEKTGQITLVNGHWVLDTTNSKSN